MLISSRPAHPPMPKAKSKAYTRIRAEVIRLVGLIPPGKFTTYGSIAVHMNIPALFVGSVRTVRTIGAAVVSSGRTK